MLQLFSMIKAKDGIKYRGELFWSVVECPKVAYGITITCIKGPCVAWYLEKL
jgi:hypothetical protein